MKRPLLGLLAAVVLCSAALAREVEEKFPDGGVKSRYNVDGDGRKHGPSVEYHDNGKVKVRTEYRAGQLDGPYTSFHDNGQPHVSAGYKSGKLDGEYTEKTASGQLRLTANYRDGKLRGWRIGYIQGEVAQAQAWRDGEIVAARGPQLLKVKLAEIEQEPDKAEKLDTLNRNRAAGLRRLMAFRYLAGLPYEDMELDDDLNRYASAGSVLLEKIGKLDHTPANPGMPEDEYRIAYKGTSRSNLYMGVTDFVKCVHGWMDDSDADNITYLGHRRWCLNPPLKKIGFGRKGEFAAMYCFDDSRKEISDYDFVSYPVRGVQPVAYFGPRWAWSISLNPKKYRKLGDAVRVKVTPLDKALDPAGEPLELTAFHTDNESFAVPRFIVFRPKKLDMSSGARYWVEVDGLQLTDGKPTGLRYLVEFAGGK